MQTPKRIVSRAQRARVHAMIKNLVDLPMETTISTIGDYLLCLVMHMIRVNGLIQQIIWEVELLTDKSRYLALRLAFSFVKDKGILDCVWQKLEANRTPSYLLLLKHFVKDYTIWAANKTMCRSTGIKMRYNNRYRLVKPMLPKIDYKLDKDLYDELIKSCPVKKIGRLT